ncbi:SGNH/GDSL hydrolase family protein [Pseudarthrobacter sp. NPDC092184]|uniref:SGNH/GDSL hydrolase family protein n=1 Tax=unclassified Pseudarthrobacter TaxID=2647000 RepID=UPI00382968E3
MPEQTKDPALQPLRFGVGTKTVIFGDSWTEGLFMHPKTLGFAHVAASQLELNAQVLGGSGTGYLSPGNDGLGTYETRLKAQSGPDLELLILQGSVNDTNKTIAELGQAFDNTVAAARTAYPNAQIVILGPAPSKLPVPQVVFNVDSILAGKAAQFGFHYISPYANQWLDEGNYPVYMNAENTHPTVEGHVYLATKLTDALKAARDIPAPAESPRVVTPTSSPLPTSAVKLSAVPSGARVLFLGDSYAAGVGAANAQVEAFPAVLAAGQGWSADVEAVPGTGYTNDNGQPGSAYSDRVKQVPGGDYDLVVIQGGQNDRRADADALNTAVKNVVSEAKQKWPAAQIVVLGPSAPQPLGAGLTEATSVIEAAVGDSAVFINPARLAWFTEANSAGLAAPDGAHLNAAGHAYLAEKIAEAINAATAG